ncbi:metal-independent alpha-mannosidase [Bifidobacterium aemilianum]|uniref:Metal-independent alpha-mannosidase n=1 Tax=Bifidobacterium aemilianum TaxID=2493120 RepID=A0A366KAB1_9BIFI|nr:glycoside hydrolase family 125 protein [Bifidobacterium aemilianum]RBP98680.1 metal-independent alpha-mannosidase [Bifidobacterium aemilianum]
MTYQDIPASVSAFMQRMDDLCGSGHRAWAQVFQEAFANTLLTTVKRQDDGTTFLLTGDIPAMWLRDSTAQVRPYLVIAQDDDDLADMIAGLVKRQFAYICIDPYANAFNETPSGASWDPDDKSDFHSPWLWERKYEVDSLCYPIQLAWLLYRNTGRTDQFNNDFHEGARKVLDVFELEQDHSRSPYFFIRDTDLPTDTLPMEGRGNPVAPTGMTWSGFRPSDDSCTYNYLVPSNMFTVVALGYLEEVFQGPLKDPELAGRARQLKEAIGEGISRYGVTRNSAGNHVYAYEVDGLGEASLMDDSNIPNLISAPYLGFCGIDDPIYQETRRTLLSPENPYYYEGSHAKGIGSSHTPPNYVWPIALAMQGLTTGSKAEQEEILNTLVATDAGTHLMHEGFDVNDPSQYTRPWFSWANMMFCELAMDYFDIRVRR